ncbi:hypothetical protein KYG_10570 [Acidovorax sp. NO-1]|nr:hypothetical protein KYG_10570 [Acidovorax sp. NO-1]
MGAPSHRPDPKSGDRPRSRPMLAIRLSELESTGRVLMSVFHALSAGKGTAPISEASTPSAAPFRSP